MGTARQEINEPLSAESLVDAEEKTPIHEASQTLQDVFQEMIQELVEYRELLFQLTLRDIRIRYKQAVMGFAWAVLMPTLIVGAGFLVKYAMAQMSGSQINVGGFAGMAVKAIPWAFFVGAIGFATNSLISNRNLVTKIYFPREVFPLSAVLAQSFDASVGSSVLAVLLFLFLGIGSSFQLLWTIPLVALLLVFTTGMALALSSANLFFRDVKYIVQVMLTFGIFFTPVFYEPVNLGPTGSRLMMLNPLTPLLEGLRLAIVEQHNLMQKLIVISPAGHEIAAWHPWYLAYAAVWSIFGCLAAWFMFHKLEFIYAEYI